MRCIISLVHPSGAQVGVVVHDLAQVDAVISQLLAQGYKPLSSPAGAPSQAAPQPVPAEPPPAARPRGCEHLPLVPNDLQVEWLRRFPDAALRDAWWRVGKARLRRKKGAALIGDTVPCIIAEALAAYEEFVQELTRQGRYVNGEALWPPKRE